MKRAGWYVIAGAAAGFAGVVGLHGSGQAAPAVLGPAKPAATGGARPAPARSGSPTARPAGSVRRVTGSVVQYGYGELSVTVTVRGSQITNVSVPLLRTAEPYSQQLAQQVIPMLKSEVLAVHSARINGVSGATYTSQAYAQSIQSALDKLHA
jgi:hypothetical protein